MLGPGGQPVGDDDVAVFVLDAHGRLYGYDKALSDGVSAPQGAPDALDLALGEENGRSLLYYPRGGAVVALDAASDAFEQVSVTTPPEGAAAWLAARRARESAQPSIVVGAATVTSPPGPPVRIAVVRGPTLRLVQLDGPRPEFENGGLRPGPLGPPPAAFGGTLTLDGKRLAEAIAPPCLRVRGGSLFAYVLVAADGAAAVAAYKLDRPFEPEPWQAAWAEASERRRLRDELRSRLAQLRDSTPPLWAPSFHPLLPPPPYAFLREHWLLMAESARRDALVGPWPAPDVADRVFRAGEVERGFDRHVPQHFPQLISQLEQIATTSRQERDAASAFDVAVAVADAAIAASDLWQDWRAAAPALRPPPTKTPAPTASSS